MMARQREPAGELEDVGGDVGGIHHFEIGQRQRAGLVEDDVIGLGQPLDRVAGIQQHAGLEHRAGGDGLHGRNGKPQRTGTGDDQHRDAGHDRIMPGCTRDNPAEDGQKRGRMHHGCVQPRGAVGAPHVARTGLQRVVEQPGDFGQQRRLGGGRDPHPQRAGDVHRSRIDRRALLGGDVERLAGDQALVDLRSPLDHGAVDRAALAGPEQHDVAGIDGCHRNLRDLVGSDELGGRLRLERGEIAGDRAGPPPHVLVEEAADQEEGQQHDRRVEICVLGVVDGLDHGHAEREDHADRDRHVHVGRLRRQRAPGRAEERLAGIGRRRQCDQRREPVEEVALLGQHVRNVARPHRDRQHHHVHGGEGGNAEAAQQETRFGDLRRLRALGLEWIGLVAELLEPIDEAARVERARLPFQRDAAVGQVDARQRDVGDGGQAALDLGHAAGAMNAFDREINVLDALARGPDVVREIPRDVHDKIPQFRITRLRDRNTRVPRASPSITRSHWPGATEAASPR